MPKTPSSGTNSFNFHTVSFASQNEKRRLGRYGPNKKGRSHKFEDAEEFDIFCDIHPEMWAKVKSVDSAYIERVVLQNLKGFKSLDFSFLRPDGQLPGWTVLTGDNGSGKTAILKAIQARAAQ